MLNIKNQHKIAGSELKSVSTGEVYGRIEDMIAEVLQDRFVYIFTVKLYDGKNEVPLKIFLDREKKQGETLTDVYTIATEWYEISFVNYMIPILSGELRSSAILKDKIIELLKDANLIKENKQYLPF